jgi:hypothetical protein
MSLELLGRIQQELSISGSALYETVLGLAERANRKVQVLRLHSQASSRSNRFTANSDVRLPCSVPDAHRSAMSQPCHPINWNMCSVRPATAFNS